MNVISSKPISDSCAEKQLSKIQKRPRRRKFVGLFAIIIALTVCEAVGQAQQQTKVPRIGYLGPPTSDSRTMAFRQGLRDLGYIEEKNILVDYRYVAGNPNGYSEVAAELARQKVDLFVAVPFQAILAAKQATKTIPIVMVTTQDPVATGIVDSLARPGGNITGLARLTRELGGKRLELLKEAVPAVSRIGVIWAADDEGSTIAFKQYEAAARPLKLALQSIEVRGVKADMDNAFRAAAQAQLNALIAIRSGLVNAQQKALVNFAIEQRLPSIFDGNDFVEAGGLMSYNTDDVESFKRAAVYMDKILKGANPADLPVEQPSKFEFVINLKTAKQIGLTIPPNVLGRADRVIR